ncbi:hypothetical protein ACTOJ1_000617 [Shigella flexneri]
MKKIILGLSFGIASVLGMSSIAYADDSYSTQNTTVESTTVSTDQVQETESPNAPDAYYEYGFGEVKADGQWVNDNHN